MSQLENVAESFATAKNQQENSPEELNSLVNILLDIMVSDRPKTETIDTKTQTIDVEIYQETETLIDKNESLPIQAESLAILSQLEIIAEEKEPDINYQPIIDENKDLISSIRETVEAEKIYPSQEISTIKADNNYAKNQLNNTDNRENEADSLLTSSIFADLLTALSLSEKPEDNQINNLDNSKGLNNEEIDENDNNQNSFAKLQDILVGDNLSDIRKEVGKLEHKILSFEYQISNREEFIKLLLPLISEVLRQKIEESEESIIAILAPIIDKMIETKTNQDKSAITAALSPIISAAIAKEIEDSPKQIAKAIAPEMSVAIKEQIRLEKDGMVMAISPILDKMIETRVQENKEAMGAALAPVISAAISKQINDNPDEIASAIAPTMGQAIKEQIVIERDAMVDALYPVIGNTIAKYMAETVRSINEQIENTFTIKGIQRKIKAKVQGVSEAELIFKEAMPFTIQAIFLIHKGSGLLISEYQPSGKNRLESDMVAGMLTAIRSFVNDCISQSGSVSELDQIDYGDSRIILEVAGYCYLAVVVKGEPSKEFVNKIRDVLGTIIRYYGKSIELFEGDTDTIPEQVTKLLESLIKIEEKDKKQQKNQYYLVILMGVIIAAIGIPWGIYSYYNSIDRKLEAKTANALSSNSELSVYNLEVKVHRNKLEISGRVPNNYLREKATEIVQENIATKIEINNNIIAVDIPPDPVLATAEVKRLESLLNNIEGIAISAKYQESKVIVTGSISNKEDAEKVTSSFEKIPGIKKVVNTLKIQPMKITSRIYFDVGSDELNKQEKLKIEQVKKVVNKYPRKYLRIIGHSDRYGGTELDNQYLALKRAKAARNALLAAGIDGKRLQVIGTNQMPLDVDINAPLWLSRCVQFELIDSPGKDN